MGVVQFEQYTIVLLTTPASPPKVSAEERGRLQDAHLSYLADLHDQGHLLAVGPLSDPDGELRGLSIFNVDAVRARELKEVDEAVQRACSTSVRSHGRFRRRDAVLAHAAATLDEGRLGLNSVSVSYRAGCTPCSRPTRRSTSSTRCSPARSRTRTST